MDIDPKLQQGFFESFPGFLSICDDSYRFIYLNKNLMDALSLELCDRSLSPIGLTGLELAEYAPPHLANFIRLTHRESVTFSKSNVSIPVVLSFKTAEEETRHFKVIKFKHTIDKSTYIFTHSTDITELKRDVEKYRVDSLIDPLTGLYNRRAYIERANEPIQTNSLVVVMDLDNFKLINDQFGHNAGDDVLSDFAHLLSCCFRKRDFISRIGGDEFVIVLDSLTSMATLIKRLHKLELCFNTAFNDKYPFLGWSYGIERVCNSFSTAIDVADKKMYDHKLRHK